jgi:GNAT superfamily N-acetyltransferase
MKRIDNAEMLALFDKDINRYFYHCYDLAMAARDGYKIKEMAYFAKEGASPLSSFLCVRTYEDDSVVVGVTSEDAAFWEEAADYISVLTANEIDVAACDAFYTHPRVAERLSFGFSESGAPIYGLLSPKDLAPLPSQGNVSVSLMTTEEKAYLQEHTELFDSFEEELRSPSVWDACDCFFDTRFYLLKEGDRVIGFLRGELGYKNYYDVGWVYVAPAYRGKGYGKLLTLYFSHDLLKNGLYPHYGYAINPESEAVAKKCGYTCTRASQEFKRIIQNG